MTQRSLDHAYPITVNEQALQRSEEGFRLLFAANPQPMWVYDRHTMAFLEVNDAAVARYGYTRDEFLRMRLTDIRPDEDHALVVAAVWDRPADLKHAGEWRHKLKDGRVIDVEIASHTIAFAGHEAVLVVATDVTERKRVAAELRRQALHDALTGLPNRTLLYDRLKQTIALARRERRPFALLLLDLDRFKEVNDTLGHQRGDALLKRVGKRLCGALRASDTVARLGGDEFAALLPAADATGAVEAAGQLLSALAAPVRVGDRCLHVGASVGIALFPDHGCDPQTLLRRADIAMYVAKRERSGHAVYAPDQDAHGPDRLALVAALRQAMTNGELTLHYQPIVYPAECGQRAAERVYRAEALLRWPHPQRGSIPPDRFIPLAEQNDLIAPLTAWVIEAAVRQLRHWRQDGRDVRLAVNLSALNLHDVELPATVARVLETFGVPPRALRVELTETAVMADAARALDVLTRLATLGVCVSVDDFGTGYSSLARLKRLPVDVLKIDRSFIQNMAHDETDRTIVRSTVDLAHSLGLRVVAEGVEDRETLDLLTELGCDAMQGYYLSRPLPAAELEARWSEIGG